MAERSGWGAVGYGLAGGFASDKEYKRKEIQLQAAQQGLQYDSAGNLKPAPWSSTSTDQLSIEALQKQVVDLKNAKLQEDTWNTFDSSITSGSWENTNKFINRPEVQPLFKELNVSNIEKFNPDNETHIGLLKSSGTNLDVVNALAKAREDGNVTPEELSAIQAAYPVIRGHDGSLSISSVEEMSILTGRAKSTYNTNNYDLIQDTIVKGKQALQGVTKKLYDAKTSSLEISNKSSELKLSMLEKLLESNPDMSAADLLAAASGKTSKEPRAEMKPFDIQTAEYFGGLKTKIDNGVASPEETATYNSWLTKEGGSGVAANEKISTDVRKLETKGIDIASPEFSLDTVEDKDKVAVNTAIRDLESTPGGKKLVNNISKKLGDGIGAVQTASSKLAELSTKNNVETAVVKNQIDAIKQYIPEVLRDISETDLKDVEFRQAFLSVTATMLKLQSGLTVSEAEAQRFAGSMGTLNKNTKVNMSGLKNKVDEIIGDYESNKALEPTLYNAKYRAPIQGLKQVSNTLDSYLGNKAQSAYKVGQVAKNPKTNETLIFDGKGWVKQ